MAVALGVIDLDLAGPRQWRYRLNIEGRARELGCQLASWIEFRRDEPAPLLRLHTARRLTGAEAVIAPSLRHLHGTERDITTWADLYIIGRKRTYRCGHRWPTS
ncbi:hypothetical protein [Nocardia wallacei]|uniref:hypothetical protein n=1 Tax=Nocardia wallacei TaxID=480035 RepID=UPI00245633B9|nr:hypothetical protein [Nocardia wallacei]